MAVDEDIIDALRLELRRSALILAVLAALRVEKYGSTLRVELAERGIDIDIDEGALYPMLRRLEAQGCWPASGARKRVAASASINCLPPARRSWRSSVASGGQ